MVATPVLGDADLVLTPGTIRPAAYEPVNPGTRVGYGVDLHNEGPDSAQNVVFRMPLPGGSTNVTVRITTGDTTQWQCGLAGDDVVCTRVSLPPSFTHLEIAADTPLSGGRFVGRATLRSDTPDPRPFNESEVITDVYRVFAVDSIADAGAGALRDAISSANALCRDGSPCKIRIDVPADTRLEPLSPLPQIATCHLVIEAAHDTVLNGSRVRSGHGLDVVQPSDRLCGMELFRLSGMIVDGFPDDGLRISRHGRSSIERSVFRANGSRGVVVDAAGAYIDITRSMLAQNRRSGLFIWAGTSISVSGSELIDNGASGAFIARGWLAVTRSTIAGNRQFGVAVAPAGHALVEETSIHSNGILGFDWNLDGPTPPRDGDPLLLNAPVILDAHYDPAADATVIRLALREEPPPHNGAKYAIDVFSSRGRSRWGAAEGEKLEKTTGIERWNGGPFDQEFTVSIPGDLRGQVISALTRAGYYPDFPYSESSEFSNGVDVH